MRHPTRFRGLLLLLVLATAAWAMQQPDLAGIVDVKPGFTSAQTGYHNHANTEDSGVRVDRQGYSCIAILATSYKSQNDVSHLTVQLVALDSTAGVAGWVARDSITIDSTDNKSYKKTVTAPAGGLLLNRWVRMLVRASGAAADTFDVSPYWLLGCKRAVRPGPA